MRYACEAIDSIWSEESKLTRWWQVWHAQLSAVDQPVTTGLASADLEWVARRAREYETNMGHDVAAAVAAVQAWLLGSEQTEQARWLHYGLCSSDVADAGYLLAIDDAESVLHSLSQGVMDALQDLSEQQKSVQTLYRTHGQAAQIGAGDARWTGYAEEFDVLRNRMVMTRPITIGLQGPTGTGGELTIEQATEIARDLGLQFRSSRTGRQAADRTQWALWSHAVAALATLAQRVATQIRLLAYEEVREVTEGRDDAYRASSSMPHKSAGGRSNPTRSERICGMAAVIRGLANGYAEACSSVWDSHSLEHSCADRILLPQITGYTGFVLTELADVLRTLVWRDAGDRDRTHKTTTNALTAAYNWPDGEDSYRRRNRLIREGADGDIWKAAQS